MAAGNAIYFDTGGISPYKIGAIDFNDAMQVKRVLDSLAPIENEKIFARLKSEGKVIGLDGYPEEFAAIREERRRRWRELLEKYRPLPLGTEIKLE